MGRCVASLSIVLLFGCGPSYSVAHQNSKFYERCNAADLDPDVPEAVRQDCWTRWLEHYSEDQSPERISYVRARLAQTQPAPTLTLDEPLPEPEKKKDKHKDYRPPRLDRKSVCIPLCEPAWQECIRACAVDRGPCRHACASEYRTCAYGCP